jgi:DNA polymerase III subunit delta
VAQIRLDQLDTQLERPPAPLYAIHGDEPLLSLEAADAIRARARKAGFTQREVVIAERGFDWRQLADSAASLSLFGDKRIVELRLPSGKPGADGAKAIEAYCARPPDDTVTIVSLPRVDRAAQSSPWFAALDRAGVLVNVYPVERARLPQWIAGRLGRQKQSASPQALQFLADSVEGNLLAAHQEIQKLALVAPQGELDFDAVREAVLNVARYDAGTLPEAMLSGDGARLVRVLEGLRGEGEAEARLVWIVAEEIRAVVRVQEGLGSGRDLSSLLSEARVWGDARKAAVTGASRKFKRKALEAALAHAARIDRIVKGVAQGDAWDELLQLGLRFAA